MTFYQSIARYYDLIFPVQAAAAEKLLALAGPPPALVLDIACGTGGYAAWLAEAGHQVYACDLDPDMVRLARERANISVFQADMLLLQDQLPDPGLRFGLIYCIGNSLVHLQDEQQILLALSQMAVLLRPHGRLLLQIINYDRILNQGEEGLPTIRHQPSGLVFSRRYQTREDGRLDFITTLAVEGITDPPLTNCVPLLPIQAGRLTALCREAGLQDLELWGSFRGNLFDQERDIPLIISARKPG